MAHCKESRGKPTCTATSLQSLYLCRPITFLLSVFLSVYVCRYRFIYTYIYIYMWCRVAASQAPPPHGMPPPPPSTGSGRTTHSTWNHKTRNQRAPSPSPPLRHTDENDGDDVVHNDVDVLFPVWLLVVPLLLCCSGLRHCMFTALFSCKPCLECDVLAKTVLTVVIPSQVSVKVSLNTYLNDFHSGLLSKEPEESADGDHDHHPRHHHHHHHHHDTHHYHWLWSSGQVGVQWNCITS